MWIRNRRPEPLLNVGAWDVQAETPQVWFGRMNAWITDLDAAKYPGWSLNDLICSESAIGSTGLVMYRSQHARAEGLSVINIRHLLITMS
ncbi:hypothetical protein [Burkholderia gladioli]|uniref:hypothetical protein n=1 Tax=Burkholderia gladioli TaxID=28095 RepID=UPI000FDA7CD6|nr:hypothetical protein [Burkholderia gladioli]